MPPYARDESLKIQARMYAHALCELLRERAEEIDEIFEGDLVRDKSFKIQGGNEHQIRLRDASGFDVMVTVTCKRC